MAVSYPSTKRNLTGCKRLLLLFFICLSCGGRILTLSSFLSFFSMYKIPDFLKKNRDALHGDLVMELKDSESVFVSAIFGGGKNNGGNGGPRTKKIRRNTKLPDSIAFKFKNQLKALNNELLKTEPHYIRCIKTNSVKSVHYFEPDICLRQLIFAGYVKHSSLHSSLFDNEYLSHCFFSHLFSVTN